MKKLDENNLSYLLEKIAGGINETFDTSNFVSPATTSNLGIVKPDGTTITINNSGVISLANNGVGIATNSSNGILKPDDTSIGITGQGALYIKSQFVPVIPPDPAYDDWFIAEEIESESDLPYILGFVGGNLVCLDKATNTINNDGFSSENGNIRIVDMSIGMDSTTHEIGHVYLGSEGSAISTSDFNFSNIAFDNNIKNKVYDMSFYGYYDVNYGGTISGGDAPSGLSYDTGAFRYIDEDNWGLKNGYLKKGGAITFFAYDNSANEYCFVLVSSPTEYKIYKRLSYQTQPFSNSLHWLDKYLATIDGYIIIHNGVIHEFERTGSQDHEVFDMNTNKVYGVKNLVPDTIDGVSVAKSIQTIKTDYYNGKLYSIIKVNDVRSIYEYDFANTNWIKIIDLPEDVQNRSSDRVDFYIDDDSTNPYVLFLHKYPTEKKIVLYGNGLNGSSGEWTKLGQCIPELWKASE